MVIHIDTHWITDWDTFHSVFAELFGFPDFYGRNMDAWIDCMTSLDAPEDGMTSIHVQPGQIVTLSLQHMEEFSLRCPEQYNALLECSAFVNWRRIEMDMAAILALAFS